VRQWATVQASLCRLFTYAYVDRDPFRAMSLPKLYRRVDVNRVKSDAELAAERDPFPHNMQAHEEMKDVCDFVVTYMRNVDLRTKASHVREGDVVNVSLSVSGFHYPCIPPFLSRVAVLLTASLHCTALHCTALHCTALHSLGHTDRHTRSSCVYVRLSWSRRTLLLWALR
jgi:hypothetical protein